MPTFTADTARTLGGPPWLVERRLAAAERFGAAPWPTTEEEIWRYSRIDELDLESFRPGPLATTVSGGGGLLVEPGAAGDLVGSVMADAVDVFAELNSAFVVEPTVISVPAGKAVVDPVVVTHEVTGDGTAAFPRLVIDAGADSEITVVERFTSTPDARALRRARAGAAGRAGGAGALPGGQRARIEGVADRQPAARSASGTRPRSWARSRSAATTPGCGPTTCWSGPGASARQIAVYFAEADQMHDFRTIQTTSAPHDERPAVQGRGGRAVPQRLHRPDRDRPRGQGRQRLPDQPQPQAVATSAWAESVPNLDIETNDVRCSHASTVGPIDEEQRFYLESRGVPPSVAERLIVLGFFDEVLDQLPAPDLVPALRRQVRAKLDRKDA